MRTPVEFIEEHNEAFLSWHRFVKAGYIPPKGNYLLHIDHHEDFVSGGYAFNPSRIPDDLEEIKRITYNDLGIANFIVPAVHKKLFSTVHILKNTIPLPVKSEKQISICKNDRSISVAKYIAFVHRQNAIDNPTQYSEFTMIENGLGDVKLDSSLMPRGKYVLDIDLDYFCWDDSLSSVEPKRIEVTKEAYEEFCSDIYHPFRILPIRVIHAREIDGKYFLEYQEQLEPDKVFSNERIEKRIVALVEWLDKQEARPAAIDICSSRYSGYLPSYAWPYVKDRLIEELEKTQF